MNNKQHDNINKRTGIETIYFLCYNLIHCNTNHLINKNTTYIQNNIISSKSNHCSNSSHSTLYSSYTINSLFNNYTNTNDSHMNIFIKTINQIESHTLKQNYGNNNNINLDFGLFDEPNEEEYENVVNFLKLKFNLFYAFNKYTTDNQSLLNIEYKILLDYLTIQINRLNMIIEETYSAKLSPGLDCPKDAIYLPVRLIDSGETGPKFIKNGICLFEWKTNPHNGPVRRHFEFHISDHFGEKGEAKYTNFGLGITSYSLVVRTISTLFNYDYIFDIIFYSSGVIEFSVTPTGYIHVDVELNPYQYNSKYGFPALINPIYMVIHHHLFHYKIDVDIVNKENFIKVVKIHGPLTENQVNTDSLQQTNNQLNHSELLWLSIDIPKTEMEARFSTKFEFPKQYLICSTNSNINDLNKTSQYYKNDKCLSIINKGQVKTIFSDKYTKSFAWSR
uniref:Amine oxidase n=1 Tax=Schistosoma haematobium TaxID=6185 RepID=A0A094ZPS7_SCHHA